MGSSEKPYTPDRVINRDIQELGFSKRKPSSVKPGDILICYGVGTRKLLGYFKVLTEPVRMQDESERWPWRVDATNLCPDYSDRWTDFENTLASLQLSYGDDKEITFVGGKSLGALNFGADKIQLNPDFAKYIINVIENSV